MFKPHKNVGSRFHHLRFPCFVFFASFVTLRGGYCVAAVEICAVSRVDKSGVTL
jgi:hypothetical protein